jgi:hypothetical protein
MVRRGLNPTSVNKCLMTLAAVFDQNVEYGVISKNVARGKGRELTYAVPRRSWTPAVQPKRA